MTILQLSTKSRVLPFKCFINITAKNFENTNLSYGNPKVSCFSLLLSSLLQFTSFCGLAVMTRDL